MNSTRTPLYPLPHPLPPTSTPFPFHPPAHRRLPSTEFLKEQTELVSRLPSLPYISDRVEGRLRTASHFYDPFVPLFVSLIDDDEFPAAPFHLPEWREFNKTAGIKNECRSAGVLGSQLTYTGWEWSLTDGQPPL